MRIAELLELFARVLEDSDNEALVLAEKDEKCLEITAKALVEAADILKTAAKEVDEIEPVETALTPESLEDVANIAEAFDASGDEKLMKMASVLDELLQTIAAPDVNYKKQAEHQLSVLREKLLAAQISPEKVAAVTEEYRKEVEKEPALKTYRILEAPLQTRYCPDHPGVTIYRVDDTTYKCPLDEKSYDFNNGYELENGSKVQGGSVQGQRTFDNYNSLQESVFTTRQQRLGEN